jgi:hypothetical protein
MMDIRYSAQYAAAQLGKLPLPHALRLEVAEFVGHHDLDLLLPPTYRALARTLGRMPTAYNHNIAEHRIKAFDYELFNYHGEVTASCMTRRGEKLVSVVRTGTLAEIRRLGWGQLMLYDIYLRPEYTLDDAEFFRAWREKYGETWPGRVGCETYVHEGLQRAYIRFCAFEDNHRDHAESVSTIINRHNSGLYVVRAFNRSNGECDTDSD